MNSSPRYFLAAIPVLAVLMLAVSGGRPQQNCGYCIAPGYVNLSGHVGDCGGYDEFTATWTDDGPGGSQGIQEGTACEPGEATECFDTGQVNGAGQRVWSCSGSDETEIDPEEPLFDYADADGYVYWQTSVEEDLGPDPLPLNDSGDSYDACANDQCYVDDLMVSQSAGDVVSEYPGYCFCEEY